jgi:7-cyano-7-deazaguanine synthase
MLKPMMTNVLILCSGGIDSTACIAYYLAKGYYPVALWVDYGQNAKKPEFTAATKVAMYYGIKLQKVAIKGIKWMYVGTSDELVGRNHLLASVGVCSFPGSHGLIAMGIHEGTGYSDCSVEFQQKMDDLVHVISRDCLAMDYPFGKANKMDIGAFCKENDVPLELTYSCLRGTVPSCGSCPSCRDRIKIKEVFGI